MSVQANVMSAPWHQAKLSEEWPCSFKVECSSSQWETQQTKPSLENENVTKLEKERKPSLTVLFIGWYRFPKVCLCFCALLLKVMMLVYCYQIPCCCVFFTKNLKYFSAFIFCFFLRTTQLGLAAQLRCCVLVEVVLNHLLLKQPI